MLKVTNSLSGKKELFQPMTDKKVLMYVCGVTPYDSSHLGHGRVYTTFDMFYRLLHFLGYSVTYCRNFTDVDDKLINKAEKEFGDRLRYKEVANKFIDMYHEDMKSLNCLPPTYEPRVSECIPEIIAFVQGLVDNGTAYVIDGDVYFSIDSFPQYGALSKHKLEDLNAGARVSVDEQKRNPHDFALWKSEPEGSFWKSPWGYGRPGWHIECSAMALKYLGKHIDVHGGGLDLVFPHHENELAQSEALYGAPFVRYWMHNGFVRINQEKMSKSLGNFFSLRHIFQEYHPMVVRYYLLSIHYRSPLEFSFDELQGLQKSYKRLCKAFSEAPVIMTNELIKESKTVNAMLEYLLDDLNTSGMWGVLFENLDEIQKDPAELGRVKAFIVNVIGLDLQAIPEKEVEITPEIKALIKAREDARLAKDFKTADIIRDRLKELGYDPKDRKL
jgi:cysteinyl-tRNA synthetase